MTAASLAAQIGHTGSLRAGDLSVDVTILDVRVVFNRTDYLVTPKAGSGQQWVSAERVTAVTAPAATRVGE